MSHRLVRFDTLAVETTDEENDIVAKTTYESGVAGREEGDRDEVRLCPTCHGRLPGDADPRRIYCSRNCKDYASYYRRHGKPTVWTMRCGRCGAWFESFMPHAKWCSDRCRTA